MLPDADGSAWEALYDQPVHVRENYDDWIPRHIIESLHRGQIALDCGSGNVKLDRPNVVRLDVALTSCVDVVGDLHKLPFRDGTIDFAFSLAVLEHLAQPRAAASEMQRVCRMGGYVYADTNFVFCYHGCPRHYFNFSLDGIRAVLEGFDEIKCGVPPYQMPSFAVANVLSTYVASFTPRSLRERRLVHMMRRLLREPMRDYDDAFPPDVAHRLAAGVYMLGIKHTADGQESIIPQPVWDAYLGDPGLRKRYPEPLDLSCSDNLLSWAKIEGVQYPIIQGYYSQIRSFDKSMGLPKGIARPPVDATDLPVSEPFAKPFRSLLCKALRALREGGPLYLVEQAREYVRWRRSRP